MNKTLPYWADTLFLFAICVWANEGRTLTAIAVTLVWIAMQLIEIRHNGRKD